MVLDMIVSSPGKMLCDLGPAVSILLVQNEYSLVFLVGPLVLLDIWVEMIVPPIKG